MSNMMKRLDEQYRELLLQRAYALARGEDVGEIEKELRELSDKIERTERLLGHLANDF